MRVKLISSKKFFDEILTKENVSLRKLSVIFRFNYSNLKQYRRGEKTLPKGVFDKLIKISPNKRAWLNSCEKLSDNWGSIKGGIIASKGKNRKKMLEYARSFRKILNVNIKLNKFFCEFYGALLGDGCISKFRDYKGALRYTIQFSGNKSLDSDYWKYLKFSLKREYGLNSYYYEYKNKNVCVLIIRNKGLCLNLNKRFKFPFGQKYSSLDIPEEIIDLDWKIKKFVLRGLFDTDGSVYAKKSEGYRYPIISISSKNSRFLRLIKKILRTKEYPAYISSDNVAVRGIENIRRWFEDIGSSNPRNFKKYEYFLKHRNLPPGILGL